jgi:MraZ protein
VADSAFRGSYTARIDEKSRLKIPSDFRRLIEQNFGRQVFVTSLDGLSARIYPMPTWMALEQKLGGNSPVRTPAANRFFDLSNYWGQSAEIDNQGRVLIPSRLREAADIAGEVDVVGHFDRLDVWNAGRLQGKHQRERETFNEDDLWRELAKA